MKTCHTKHPGMPAWLGVIPQPGGSAALLPLDGEVLTASWPGISEAIRLWAEHHHIELAAIESEAATMPQAGQDSSNDCPVMATLSSLGIAVRPVARGTWQRRFFGGPVEGEKLIQTASAWAPRAGFLHSPGTTSLPRAESILLAAFAKRTCCDAATLNNKSTRRHDA